MGVSPRHAATGVARFGLVALGIAGLLLGSVTAASATPAAGNGWHTRALDVPLHGAAYAWLYSVSCTARDTCAAGGEYSGSGATTVAIVDTESAGNWSTAPTDLTMPGTGAHDAATDGVDCPSAGDCVAVGSYAQSGGAVQPFAAIETGGSWGAGRQIQLPANAQSSPGADLDDVSCVTPSGCEAVGFYLAQKSGDDEMMAVADVHGKWRRAAEIAVPASIKPTSNNFLNAITCRKAGFCVAVGSYSLLSGKGGPLIAIESRGRWHRAASVGLPRNGVAGAANSVSCVSNDRCVVVGSYIDSAGHNRAFAFTLRGDHVGRPVEVSAHARRSGPSTGLYSVSCTAKYCLAIGTLASGTNALAVTYLRGRWAGPVRISPPASAARRASFFLEKVVCFASGACTAAGGYQGKSGQLDGALTSRQ
jgi:hypothetical protein